jgi:hypothetical protein
MLFALIERHLRIHADGQGNYIVLNLVGQVKLKFLPQRLLRDSGKF